MDFGGIKQDVSIRTLLRHYGVQLRRSGRDQYRGRCPIHGGEGRDAFHANFARNVFHCFACGAGGTVLDFVALMERCSLYEAACKLQGMTCGLTTSTRMDRAKELVTKRRKVPLPLKFALTPIDSTHPYLAERSITYRTAVGVGFYGGPGLMRGRLVIPIHNAGGELIAYCGRAITAALPRYRVPRGFAKSEILFNLHRAVATGEPTVVVVEGFFDSMKVHQAGIRSVVALMGAALYEPQHRALMRHFRDVILMLDGDAAGQRASQMIAANLRRRCEVVNLPDGVQPDQLSAEQIRHILFPALQRRLPSG